MQYWSNVLHILREKVGAEVIVTAVPGCVFRTFTLPHSLPERIFRTGSITSRSVGLDRVLREKARGRGINFMAHSMGGLDCTVYTLTIVGTTNYLFFLFFWSGRHLISHLKPTEYTPLSLTAICTPHRGSPFMDWCAVCLFHLSSVHFLILSRRTLGLEDSSERNSG